MRPREPAALHVATWNVHGFVGADGRRDLERTLAVIRELDVDAIALQEVDSRPGGPADPFEHLARRLGYQAVEGITMHDPTGRYGNLLLSRVSVQEVARVDLSCAGREPRGAILARLAIGDAPLRVVVTHLGLRARERREQARRLAAALDAEAPALPTLLLADLNEWRPLRFSGLSPLWRHVGRPRPVRSFPARSPLLALDRIGVAPSAALEALAPHVSPAARRASDHLPVRAVIRLAAGARGRAAPGLAPAGPSGRIAGPTERWPSG